MTAYDPLKLFIAGSWRDALGRDTIDVINPANGARLGLLPVASKDDLETALESAQKGFDLWKRVSPYDRAKVLRKAATLIRERLEHISTILTLEQGKPIAEARSEILVAADHFDWHAEEGRRAYGRIIPGRGEDQRLLVLMEPVGPVAAFTPWNFPGHMPARKIATALAAGCSCIIKPAEETPGTALALARALQDAGLPDGVLSVVYGNPGEISTHLITSPIIRKISFTGSTAVGKLLAGLAAKGLKRATMELGGHAPVIVFEDTDVERVAELSVAAKFRNAGQVCISPTRFYIHESVEKRFAMRFAEVARALPVGNGLDPTMKMGPTANPRRQSAMESLVSNALKHGADLLAGGSRLGNKGYYWHPTVLRNVPVGAEVMTAEPFGPLAVINSFRSFDEVVARANSLPYGLASYAFTSNDKTAIRISNAIEAGMVGLNSFNISWSETPFGGVKDSGYGSEGGTEGLISHLTTKFVSHTSVL